MPGDRKSPEPWVSSLSGGGIRSATFALGALQTLCRLELPVLGTKKLTRALIEFIDYLSTVSGGGYIGSWFVANRKREMQEKKTSPERVLCNDPCGRPAKYCDKATEQVAHLRRYSHYLNPDPGVMSADTWTIVTIWLRNSMLIQAMVFCVVASCFMLPHLWLRVVNGIPRVLGAGLGPLAQANDGVVVPLAEGRFPLVDPGLFLSGLPAGAEGDRALHG
jgi:hypothetical protein